MKPLLASAVLMVCKALPSMAGAEEIKATIKEALEAY